MNEHEKLIEEAAKAIADLHASSYVDEHDRATARAALAVFEKAQGEPSDEQVNAALNAHRLSDLLNSGYGAERFHESPDLSYWHPDNVSNMRAALRAAFAVEN